MGNFAKIACLLKPESNWKVIDNMYVCMYVCIYICMSFNFCCFVRLVLRICLNALYVTEDTCASIPYKVSTIYGVVGTIRLLAGM